MSEFTDHIETIKKGYPDSAHDYSFERAENERQRKAFNASVKALSKAVERGPLAESAAEALREVIAEQARRIAHLEADVVRLSERKLIDPPAGEHPFNE